MFEKIMYFFVIGTLIGWMLEATFKTLINDDKESPGILKGPFLILYGVGLVFLAVILSNYASNIILLFILSAFFLSTFEYITAVLLKKIYDIKLWDYSQMPFKINDKLCLEFTMLWGLLGVVFIKYILPFLDNIYGMLQGPLLSIVLMAIIAYIVIDLIYSSEVLIAKKSEKALY